MIEKYTLDSLLKNYDIDTKKVLEKSNSILEYGKYHDIDKTLNYLINELHISAKNIEKCPSVMYENADNIRKNLEFLAATKIRVSSIETSLHILSTNPAILKETYTYILKNYGIEYINKTTSILRVPVDRIKRIEKKLNDKSLIMSASISKRSIDEIEKILMICQENNIKLNHTIFKQTSEGIEKIIEICKKNNIEMVGGVFLITPADVEKIVETCKIHKIKITGSVFIRTYNEFEKIIVMCTKYNIPIMGSVFLKTPGEIEKIIAVCNKYNVKVTGSVFFNSPEELEKIVLVCNKYNIEITGGIFLKSHSEIERIIIICNQYNIPITGSVFLKSAAELEKIIKTCNQNNISLAASIFLKSSEELNRSINYIKENYGEEYLTPLIINKNVEHLKIVLPYLESLGVLPYVIKSASILNLSIDEIKERQTFIEANNGALVLKNGRFNSIFGLSRTNYKNIVSQSSYQILKPKTRIK